jgi:hypothetical protein
VTEPERRKDAAELTDEQLAEMAKGNAAAAFLLEMRKALAELKKTRAALSEDAKE